MPLSRARSVCQIPAERPKYKKLEYCPRTLTHEITKEIDKWLKENERRKSMDMRKQCLKRQGIHRQHIEKGMNVSYSSVCKYIARKKSEKTDKTKEAYLRIHREPGLECEFDWGEGKLCIDGRKEVLTMAVFAFPHSKGRQAVTDAVRTVDSAFCKDFYSDVPLTGKTLELLKNLLDNLSDLYSISDMIIDSETYRRDARKRRRIVAG